MTRHKACPVCAHPACTIHTRPARNGSTRTWRATRAQVIQRDHGICRLCGEPGANSAHHVTPHAHGGTDDPTNLVAAHLTCHTGLR